MKIAIYGISRAGKDYLIGNLKSKAANLFHLRGSETLKRLSLELHGKPFAETTEDEKNVLRIAFTSEAASAEKQYGNVVVDGHYAFPNEEGGYRIAFTEADKMLYDAFIYLKPKTAQIIENQKRLKDGKPVRQFSESEIEAWEQFEIKEMQKICKELDKELIVLDGDIPVCTAFLKELIDRPAMSEPRKLVKDMLARHASKIERFDTVIVMDCDKTISIKDTGELFCKYVGLERSALKEIFKGDYYSIYQFYKWKKLFARYLSDGRFNEACNFAIAEANINSKLINDISKKAVLTVGITTSLLEIWQPISQSISFPEILFGNIIKDTDLIISATAKRMLVEELQKSGKRVIAIGDGILDVPMLEAADKAFIIAEEKLSNSVVKYFANNKTDIKQLAYSKSKYDNVEVVNSIWS